LAACRAAGAGLQGSQHCRLVRGGRCRVCASARGGASRACARAARRGSCWWNPRVLGARCAPPPAVPRPTCDVVGPQQHHSRRRRGSGAPQAAELGWVAAARGHRAMHAARQQRLDLAGTAAAQRLCHRHTTTQTRTHTRACSCAALGPPRRAAQRAWRACAKLRRQAPSGQPACCARPQLDGQHPHLLLKLALVPVCQHHIRPPQRPSTALG
jgi:hypothetical protein